MYPHTQFWDPPIKKKIKDPHGFSTRMHYHEEKTFYHRVGLTYSLNTKTSERIYKFVILKLDKMGPTQNISLNGFNPKFQGITDILFDSFQN